jgi:parallel beta-helix repeat protein
MIGKLTLSLIVIFSLSVAVLITTLPAARAQGIIIYIRANGLIQPSTTLIQTVDNITYALTSNIDGHVVVERNNTIIDGAGHTIKGQGIGNWAGIFLSATRNITVKNVKVDYFDIGIWVGSSSNCLICENTATNIEHAIKLGSSNNNTIHSNRIVSNDVGIMMIDSSHNTIIKNNITNNYVGIWLNNCSNNQIQANNITGNNGEGIQLQDSSQNLIYHNSIMNNAEQVYIQNSTNVWDAGYPSGGNHWSDYPNADLLSGTFQNETGSDGIGDQPKTLDMNNVDSYPLMGTFYDFPVLAQGISEEHVQVISNSTIYNFEASIGSASSSIELQQSERYIKLFLSGGANTTGFCRVTIPRSILNGTYIVLVDWNPVSVQKLAASNGTHAYLYFSYAHSKHEVVIIPEFPPIIMLLLMMVLVSATIKAAANGHKKD